MLEREARLRQIWPMTDTAITLVTVVFAGETNLLRLQARSIQRFADPNLISDIIIVLNEPYSRIIRRIIRDHILPEYGDLRGRVRLIAAAGLIGRNKSSWRSQQALKLAVAKHVKTAFYVCLDAKNHYIRPLKVDDVFDDAKRPKFYLTRVTPDMAEKRSASLAVFGLTDGGEADRHLPYVTPFPMPTTLVTDMLAHIKHHNGYRIIDLFKDRDVIEFQLLDAWLRQTRIAYDAVYALQAIDKISLTFWRASPVTGNGFLDMSSVIDAPHILMLGLHRRLFGHMPRSFKNWIASVWLDRGLVQTHDEAEAFLTSSAIDT